MPTDTFFNLSKDKQNKILEASINEFSIRNLDEGNISHIVNEAKISRGSFYQYFDSKEDLYIYIFGLLRSNRRAYLESTYKKYKTIPFIQFFKEFHFYDSKYLLTHPSHVELGKHLYTCKNPVARALITEQQTKYRDLFLIGIEYDKEIGLISKDVESAALADLFTHFCTDIFIFNSLSSKLSMSNLEDRIDKLVYIVEMGIKNKST